MNAGLDQYCIVHFATYGMFNSRSQGLSGIPLSQMGEARRAHLGLG